MTKNIIVANNHLANIGDAFYQLAILNDLREVFQSSANVVSGEERSCHLDRFRKYYSHNVFDYSFFGEAQWYVLSGPILNKGFGKLYLPLLKKLKEKQIKLIMISVGGLVYSPDEIKHCRDILKEYTPHILSTRDSETFENYKDLAHHSYDGICSAFYSSLHYQGFKTPDLENYIVYAFDEYTEPKIILESSQASDKSLNLNVKVLEGSKGKISRMERLVDFFRKYPNKIEDRLIIRLAHNTIEKETALITYRRPNTFVSLNPYSYLNIIKNSSLVLSTRVHACVPALSYQVPAMLFISSKRASSLFERLGMISIMEKPITLRPSLLKEEHEKFLLFLQKTV